MQVDDLQSKLFFPELSPSKQVSQRIKVPFTEIGLILGKKAYSNYMVRTDPQTRKITTMFASQIQPSIPDAPTMEGEYEIVQKDRVPMKLGSVRELREEVMNVAHNGTPFDNCLMTELTELFANHTFVGIVDGWRRLAAIQHVVKLYLIDYGAVW
jgi:DNA mismatch repair protein MLH1